MNTQDHPDGWADFAELLGLIRTLFGDALKAKDALAPKIARSASRWLRAAEAFARVLLLTLARGVVLAPLAPRPKRARPVQPRTGGGRSLFALSRARRARAHHPRREMTEQEMQDWYLFGGRERAAERRELRKAEAQCVAPAPCRQRREPPHDGAAAGWKPALRGLQSLPTQANLVRRYNTLVRVITARPRRPPPRAPASRTAPHRPARPRSGRATRALAQRLRRRDPTLRPGRRQP